MKMKIIYCVLMFYIFGTYTCQNNEEDETMRMFLRGRPVIPYEPSDQESLDPAKVAPPPPQNKLTIDWMNGYTTGDGGDSNSRGRKKRSNYISGIGNVVSGDNHVIIGNFNTVSGNNNTVTGDRNNVSGNNHVVVGYGRVVSG